MTQPCIPCISRVGQSQAWNGYSSEIGMMHASAPRLCTSVNKRPSEGKRPQSGAGVDSTINSSLASKRRRASNVHVLSFFLIIHIRTYTMSSPTTTPTYTPHALPDVTRRKSFTPGASAWHIRPAVWRVGEKQPTLATASCAVATSPPHATPKIGCCGPWDCYGLLMG